MDEQRFAVVIRGDLGQRLDGCGARRGHFLESLGPAARLVELPGTEVHAGCMARVAAHGRAMWMLLAECLRGEGTALFFYPELPLLQPATLNKLPVGMILYGMVRVLLALRGRRMILDIVDIVRWQEVSLHLRRRSSPRVIRSLEGILFRMADEVWLPSHELARWLARDLALPEYRFRVVPHHPPRATIDGPATGSREPESGAGIVRFVYVGGLSLDEDRGIRQLVDAFRREVPRWAELHLAGEHGEWLGDLHPVPGLHFHGLLPERELISLVRRCDIGLIPYPEWGYYRTVLPAKLSFYESCGVEVVSTELPEVIRWIARGGRGQTRPYRHFLSLFRQQDPPAPGWIPGPIERVPGPPPGDR